MRDLFCPLGIFCSPLSISSEANCARALAQKFIAFATPGKNLCKKDLCVIYFAPPH